MAKSSNTLFVISLSAFTNLIGFGIVIPLLPFYAKSFGASASTITLLFSVYALASFVTTLFLGSLSDRVGRRPLLLLSLAGSAIAYLWFALANSLITLFLARALAGAMSYSIVIAQAYVGDITTPENRSKGMGILGAALGLGFTLGPALSGVLVGLGGDNPNLRLPLFIAALFSFAAFLLAWKFLPVSQSKSAPSSHSKKPQSKAETFNLWLVIKENPIIAFLISLGFFLRFGLFITQTILALWLNEIWGWSAEHTGYAFLLLGLVTVVTQGILIGRIVKTLGEVNMLILGLGITVVAFVSFPLAKHLYVLLFTLVLLGFGDSLFRPSLGSLLSQAAGTKYQGSVLGAAQSLTPLGAIAGPFVSGLLFEYVNPGAPFIASALLFGSQIVLAWIWLRGSNLSNAMSQRRQRKLKRLFQMLDYDGNGAIEPQDFETTVASLAEIRGWSKQSQEYQLMASSWLGFGQRLLELADANGDGKIELHEWLDYLAKRFDHGFADAFLQLMDVNLDGEIAVEELTAFYKTYDLDVSEISNNFKRLDLNQDGSISRTEMAELFDQFLYSEEELEMGSWLFPG
ncbi:MAG: MFS transporter [Moorea sp. SIOASIH]|uniref:MFS transporter n=1 Tax=Moorena sp. SIOASIH TaxID=2607817 RepID=UPI0013BB18FD|nr:MFS transporter [Moorena sp. SIOASIH]NEO42036.1 MFS transporter [Moorena sp. SIOASIH]